LITTAIHLVGEKMEIQFNPIYGWNEWAPSRLSEIYHITSTLLRVKNKLPAILNKELQKGEMDDYAKKILFGGVKKILSMRREVWQNCGKKHTGFNLM